MNAQSDAPEPLPPLQVGRAKLLERWIRCQRPFPAAVCDPRRWAGNKIAFQAYPLNL